MSPPKDLVAFLLQEHAIRADLAERVRREHERSGRPQWLLLKESGQCSEDLLFRTLRRWGGVPGVAQERLSGLRIPQELQRVLPRELASALGVLPLMRTSGGKRLDLAMVDPLSEPSALRGVLVRIGVQEIQRFLIHPAVLSRYLPDAYSDTAPTRLPGHRPGPGGLPLSDRPTDMVALPERRIQIAPRLAQRGDEQTELLPGQRAPARVPARVPPARSAAITQPIPQVPPAPPAPSAEPRPASVQIDPALMAEIERLDQEPASEAPPLSQEITHVTRRPTAQEPFASARTPILPVGPPPAPVSHSAVTPTDPRRAPVEDTPEETTPPEHRPPAPPPPAPAPPAPFSAAQYLPQVLLLSVEALVRELEKRLLPAGEPGPTALSQLSRRAARQAGLFQHGAEEIGFLGLLYGAQRLCLRAQGPLPPALEGELGWAGSGGLFTCLHNLQSVLRRMEPTPPEPGADPERAVLPLGRRVVLAADAALLALRDGARVHELLALLGERGHELLAPEVEAVVQVLLAHPEIVPARPAASADGNEPTDPDPTHELALPVGSPLPSEGPEVAEADIEIEMAEVSDAGLEVYQVEQAEES